MKKLPPYVFRGLFLTSSFLALTKIQKIVFLKTLNVTIQAAGHAHRLPSVYMKGF